MTWFHHRRPGHTRRAHEHDFHTHRLGAGLCRRICVTCGHISLAVVPMQCWAMTEAGVRCRAYSLKSTVGPVCLAHAHAAIDWRRAVLDSIAVRFQPPPPRAAATLEIHLDTAPPRSEYHIRSRPAFLST